LLLVLLFLLIIRPVIKTVKEINTSGQKTALPAPNGKEAAEGEDEDLLDISFDKGKESLLPKPEDLPPVEQALYYAREDMSKTTNIIKAWLKET
jgi:flagellar M-ring protein FliF